MTMTSSGRHWWFYDDPEYPDEARFWPFWLVRLHSLAMQAKCLGLWHRFEEAGYGDGMPMAHAWYCVKCLGPYERDEEFVLSGTWKRLLWRISHRLYHWWDSWAWRFER